MTTTPTIPGIAFSIGQKDDLEAKVITQLRALRDTYERIERPYTIVIHIAAEQVTIFAGKPAGRVDGS